MDPRATTARRHRSVLRGHFEDPGRRHQAVGAQMLALASSRWHRVRG
jgi:hypothetical protein